MFIMGKLSCVGDGSSTQRGKERKRRRYAYYFKNREICRGSFLFVYGVGSKYVKNIVSHLNENGFVPRIHKNKNRRPGNAFNFEDLKNAVNIIQNYADEFGLPQPNGKKTCISTISRQQDFATFDICNVMQRNRKQTYRSNNV